MCHVLEERDWRIEGEQGAARLLGLHPNTLRNRMRKLGLYRPSVPRSLGLFEGCSRPGAPTVFGGPPHLVAPWDTVLSLADARSADPSTT